MTKAVLDSSVLIGCWLQKGLAKRPAADARSAAAQLIELWDTDAIVSPVYIECVAGTKTGRELAAMRVFLAQFNVVDAWHVLPQDWKGALRFAERVPRDGKRRDLGDCLVRAIAERLNYDINTLDKRLKG
jgi:predicted nucleic acid-binding protein